jgi:acetate kinase
MNVYINRIVKYIGSYTALMGGVDVITLTAGALENSGVMRKLILDKLGFLGIELNESVNDFRGEERVISTENSPVKVMVIPTNEEFVIANDTFNLVK